ncbi:MAG: hypothetical protein HY291_02855 [Planctomycetes bacterium]|nr:hypothetical protein [Planctomycetota bacterium]
MRAWIAIAVVGICIAAQGSAWAVASFVAGADETFGWERADINMVRSRKKPTLVYVYDSTLKQVNHTGQYFEVTLLGVGQTTPNAKVREAISGFYKVRIRADEKGWPDEIVNKGKDGAALYVMTGDGTVVGAWWKGNQGSANDFINACKTATAANDTAVARMEKNPPPKFEHRKEPEKTEDKAPVEEKKPVTTTIPGLGNDGEKKTDAPKKTEEKKTTGKVEDE